MPFGHILGQPTAVQTLIRALQSGQAHHAYRFEGPDGVGKELAALAFAQALLCTDEEPLGCGTCDACRRVVSCSTDEPRLPLHPDLSVVERGLYPPETIGRSSQEAAEISVQQIRQVVLARAPYGPHEGRARIFLVRRAEELSTSAANALLKTLEEPRQGTYFVLLTAGPDRLLSTIRSRSLPVRFAPLPDEVVGRLLRERGVDEERVAAAVALCGGSAGAAFDATDPERSAERQQFVSSLLDAVTAPDLGRAVLLSESLDGDRHRLRANLAAVAAHFAQQAREALRHCERQAEVAALRYQEVVRAVDGLERHASINLTVSTLVRALRMVR